VIDPAAFADDAEIEPDAPRPTWRWLPAVIAALALVAALLWLWSSRPPDDDSLEAGFARDMIVHHDQAVRMALIIRDKTADPLVKSLATDVILTQENQMGQMLGWLTLWGLPATGTQPPMAWMGHPTDGLMPGMASPQELAHLESLSGPAADAELLRLMIRHHQGGILMAEAASRSRIPAVRTLAASIVTSQQAEITVMEEMLEGVVVSG
jgi:uncharacterized protein (DUF305 family)